MHVRDRRPSLPLAAIAASFLLAGSACSIESSPAAVEREPIPAEQDGDPAEPEDEPSEGQNPVGEEPSGGAEDTAGDGDPPPEAVLLEWTSCEDLDDPSLECAVLDVPLDHDDPDGDRIDLGLVRLRASAPRLGAVLLNPGGPGASGVDFAATIASYATMEIGLDGFDIIGFDPRGVDRSNGLRCLSDAEMDALLFPAEGDPVDPDERDGLDGDLFATACASRYGDTLGHFSTLATARDMDLIRAALGDEQLSYIGISYGTYLGAAYATLFPERVRAMVLDSGFEPTGDTLEQRYLTQLIGFEEAFDAWAADCEADPDCAVESRPVDAAWDELRDRLDAEPLPNGDGRAADGSVLETATITALYSPLSWARLSAAVRDATAGDPGGLFELADLYLGRDTDGTYDTVQQSNRIISCASGFGAAVPDDPAALAELIRTSAPRWGRDIDADSFDDRCAPLMDPVELPELGFEGDAPVIVIGGVNDPATPFRWSEELVATMGPSASLVTWNGEGHGMLFGSGCLMDHAHDVLVRLTTPAEGEVCDPDPDVPRPDWWDALPVPEGVSTTPLGPDAMVVLGLPSRLVFGEARTSTLPPDRLLGAYRDALGDLGFRSVASEEPIPGLIVETFLDQRFSALSIIVLTEAAYADPELAPARRLAAEGETLFALITFG